MTDDSRKRVGAKSLPLIPPEALPEWRNLVSALEVHGPVPCEDWENPDAWHADKGRQLDEALAGCCRCGAAPECLSYALAADERFGVYGGLTAGQRRGYCETPAKGGCWAGEHGRPASQTYSTCKMTAETAPSSTASSPLRGQGSVTRRSEPQL